MSSAFDCCLPCPPGSVPSANIVNIPGAQGDPGAPGADGANGADGGNAFCTTLADVLIPVIGNTVSVPCNDVTWMQVGQNVFMSGAAGVANFVVVSKNTTTNFAVLEFLGYQGDLANGTTIATGAGISPAGVQVQPLYPPTAYFVFKFVSGLYTIALGQIPPAGVAHSLTGMPEIVHAYLVSVDGSEGGYTALDEVDVNSVYHWDGGDEEETGSAFAFGTDAAKVWASYVTGTNGVNAPLMPGKSSTTYFAPTLTDASKWKLKLVAVKLDAP